MNQTTTNLLNNLRRSITRLKRTASYTNDEILANHVDEITFAYTDLKMHLKNTMSKIPKG